MTFLRYELRDADKARDVGHAFFADILGGGGLAHAAPEHGRFRSYLLGAVKHFLSHEREAAGRVKRGRGVVPLSLDDDPSVVRAIPDANVITPEAAYDRQWALTTVARALDVVRQKCAAEGRTEFFEKVKPWLTGSAVRGDQGALAAACGMTPAAFKMALQRMKSRFREAVRAEITGTLEDPTCVAEEMASLFAALSG